MTAYEQQMTELVRRIESLEETCTQLTGLRHGPEREPEFTDDHLREFVVGLITNDPSVAELVKVAAQTEAYFRAECAPTSDVLLFLDGLRAALKPFEQVAK